MRQIKNCAVGVPFYTFITVSKELSFCKNGPVFSKVQKVIFKSHFVKSLYLSPLFLISFIILTQI